MKMLNILVLTKNHPTEIIDVIDKLYSAFGQLDKGLFIGSPQASALMVSEQKNVPYLQTYYPAMRAYNKVEEFAEQNQIHTIVTVGAVDVHSLNKYNAIIGLKNDDLEDYKNFDEDFNTTNIKSTTLKSCDILFDTIEEVIHFIRIVMKNDAKEKTITDDIQ